MKRYWKHAMAAATLAWVSGNASAQPAPVGLPATQNANPQAVTPIPSVPPIPPVPSEPPQAVVPPPVPAQTVSTTQAPPLASAPMVVQENGEKIKSMPAQANGDTNRFGTAKCEPPPNCCPALCCPAPNPVVCTNHGGPEYFDNNYGPAQKWHWEVGGGVYYVQPFFHTNPAFLRFKATGLSLSTQQSDFRYNMQVAPLGWISYVSDAGWGIRGRYFQFDQGARETFTGDGTSAISSVPTNGGVGSVFAGAAGDVADFSSRLRVEVWDLEGTYTFASCRWNFLAAAGVRYANMFQSYDAKSTPAGGALPSSTSTVSSFNGAGPTFALESKYRFGESGLAVYGTARGSVLFGPGRLTAGSSTNIGNNVLVTQSFESHQSDILPIGEAEVGLEFGRSVGSVRVFAQTGFVGQAWFGGGNAASTNLGGHSFSNDTNFGFVGIAGRLGVNF